MKLVVDNKIPLASGLASKEFKVQLIDAQSFDHSHLKDADALIVRSITKVDERLLKESNIKFVGSPTAGFDHLDTQWLEQNNIAWANTPGANAGAVAEYVACCVRALQQQSFLPNTFRTTVIGVGQIGSRVVNYFQSQNIGVAEQDPPRGLYTTDFNCDLICLHTPLTHSGEYATHHMIDDVFLSQLKPGTIILNAGRGAVLDTQAALKHKQHHYCLDVWEDEPDISLALLEQSVIATPHIAGYSHAAKNLAAARIFNQAFKKLGIDYHIDEAPYCVEDFTAPSDFDPIAYTRVFKQNLLSSTKDFIQCRQQYSWR